MRLFLLFFFSIYGGMHVYVFLKARAAFSFGPRAGVPLALWMIFMVLAPLIVRITERQGHEALARGLAYLGYTWFGLVFLFVSASLLMDSWRLLAYLGDIALGKNSFIPVPSATAAFFLILVATLSIAAYGLFEAGGIRTERVVIASPKISKTLKIAQISDVHLGLMQGRGRLDKILRILSAEKPDVLVSTGDLVDGQIDGLSELIAPLREVTPRYGKYAIMGNHEYYAGLRQSLEFLEKTGFNVLRGKGMNVEGLFNIAGVDDTTQRYYGKIWYEKERDILGKLPRGKFTLFLKHRPYVEPESTGLFDLQLSGHTHKGQIFPFTLVVRAFYPYLSGLFDLPEGSSLYVSRGTGTWGPPIRFLSPPEMTLIELRPAP
jgi:predicted MPP superfamily phosphohydrolase